MGINTSLTLLVSLTGTGDPGRGRLGARGNMASPPHQQLLLHHSTEVSCDSSGDSNSVRVKINPKQLSSNSHPFSFTGFLTPCR